VKFRCKLPSPYSIFGIQKPGMFSRPVGWGYDLDKQMKKQSLYCSSQSSPFKVWTMRKHTGKTPLAECVHQTNFDPCLINRLWRQPDPKLSTLHMHFSTQLVSKSISFPLNEWYSDFEKMLQRNLI
jgi:hypothetical protein